MYIFALCKNPSRKSPASYCSITDLYISPISRACSWNCSLHKYPFYMLAKIFNHGVNANKYLSYPYLHSVVRIQGHERKSVKFKKCSKSTVGSFGRTLPFGLKSSVRCHENLGYRQVSSIATYKAFSARFASKRSIYTRQKVHSEQKL